MLMCAKLFMLVASITLISSSPFKQSTERQCNYKNCAPLIPSGVNVHLIPHSHDDVGWLKTLNEYFNGVSAVVGVEYVISSVLQSLKRNPDRKYTQVETAFFWKWWQHQSEETKNDFRKLVNNGQIEIANGGFVMNDEACVNYRSTIHQFTRGLRILNDTLGPCGAPRVGWQIDPFGHSREQAIIFKQLGFDGAFFSRLDFRDRLQRMSNSSLNFLWKSSPNIDNSEIFYTILMNHYGAPKGFCYDYTCYDDAINDNLDSFDYNGDSKKVDFAEIVMEYVQYATTSNILIPMGGDFNYEAAEEWFINMDRLIKLFKNDPVFNVFYSTPSCYIKAVNKESPKLLQKIDDFFPYTSEEHAYWTGYYTSRPNSKRFERTAFNILQASKQLRAISKMSLNFSITDTDPHLTNLQDSVAVMQHHDAITGTEKQRVANEYNNQMLKGIVKSEESIGAIVGSLFSKSNTEFGNLKLTSCLLANVSMCKNSNKPRFAVTVFNPLSKAASSYVRLPVTQEKFSIIGPTGTVSYDVVQSISNFSYLPVDDMKPTDNEIVFLASNIPPLGMNLYYISKDSSIKQIESHSPKISFDSKLSFGTEAINFVLDSTTFRLKTVTMNNITLNITQDFYYYPSENGQHEIFASGAYLFRPLKGTKAATKVSDQPGILEYTFKGDAVEEARVRINKWIVQIIRVYKNADNQYIEFDWLVGPIEVDDKGYIGKEIITRFEVADFNNSGIFYTDSKGRELIERTRNCRVDYDYDSTIEPIASNYYPVTSRIVMRDENKNLEVALLNDRSQGGSSLNDGELELMVHRRLLVDDYKGVAEALNEQEFNQGTVARGKHFLAFGNINSVNGISIAQQERDIELRQSLAAYVLVADASDDNVSLDKINKSLNFQFNLLSKSLPENINILTLETWNNDEDTYLLRLEHLYEKDEDPNLSKAVPIQLDDFFLTHKIAEIKETTLGANQWLDDYKSKEQMKWNGVSAQLSVAHEQIDSMKITLKPMEIRTFIIKIRNK